MQKSNQRLNTFISEITSGEASSIPSGEEDAEKRIWSGEIAEINEATFSFYEKGSAGAPKMMQDHWFILSDAKLVDQPGILFWRDGDQYFARCLDQDQWDKFIKAAKVNKKFW
ncbi:unnamed protein product [uncultured bacterium]|nr:unnamed protein product [uncultured bacterium]